MEQNKTQQSQTVSEFGTKTPKAKGEKNIEQASVVLRDCELKSFHVFILQNFRSS